VGLVEFRVRMGRMGEGRAAPLEWRVHLCPLEALGTGLWVEVPWLMIPSCSQVTLTITLLRTCGLE
jgi:hypothetical protein